MNFFKRKLEIFKINFKKFWKKAPKSNLPQELIEITDKFIISDSFKYVSYNWHHVNIILYKQLMETGIDVHRTNTVVNYFSFVNFDNTLIENASKNVENIKINYEINLFKKHHLLDYR